MIGAKGMAKVYIFPLAQPSVGETVIPKARKKHVEYSEKEHPAQALYVQILQDFREHIRTGALTAGARLPTEQEIARQYQTSRGTVRQALGVLANEGVLERIQGSGTFVRKAVEGKQPEPVIAPTLATMPKSIGVILNQNSDELSWEILLGVEQAVKPHGYQISFAYAQEDTEELACDIARLKATTVGLVILPTSDVAQDSAIAELKEEGFPFVLVDRYFPDLACDYVISDNIGGGYRATEHLLILGYAPVGFAYSAAGGFDTTSVRDRFAGYRKALREYQQPFDETLVYAALPDPDLSPEAYDDLLRRPDLPRAIFTVNDSLALGLLQAAQRKQLRVPEDLALVGFDDVSYAAHVSVPLTTVAQQRTEMGLRAGILLMNRIEHGTAGPTSHVELPTSLIIRQSCGARQRVSPPASLREVEKRS